MAQPYGRAAGGDGAPPVPQQVPSDDGRPPNPLLAFLSTFEQHVGVSEDAELQFEDASCCAPARTTPVISWPRVMVRGRRRLHG